ncbi:RecB-like helicase [Sulfurimonas sp.]|uniref:RecB-like helicase n=1 Tax=Sulfurimonas sp. TaxID=2022749 RepID=UPI0035637AC1
MSKFINNLAYEASAGSGKTFMLVVRYLSLLFQGASASKILALTFTNKAAAEMQERVVLTLEELEKRGELDVIAEVTGYSKEHLLSERSKILAEFLNSNTKIMTIDAFFTQILRKFSLYASLMPDFSTMSSQHELKLLSRFLKEVEVAGKKETLITLSLQSKKRLNDIFLLLDQFYTKRQELSHISFKKQPLEEHEAKALEAFKKMQEIVNSCEVASQTALNGVSGESFEDVIAKSWIGRETMEYRTFAKCFTPDMDRCLTDIQDAIKEHSKAREQNFFYALNELVDIYEKSKKALYMDDSELSFNDVTVLVHYLLKERVDSEFLYFRLDSQIEHMLLDEFQDTSIMQYEILKPLINEITSGKGVFENGSFFFVGDVKQSIYRFRGGVSALFGEVARENSTQTEPLLTNYRSQKQVIEFVNRVFEHKIKDYKAQLVRSEANGGYVEVIQNDGVLEEVLKQVKNLLSLGAKADDIAILCATNGDGEEVKLHLEHEGIEVVTETTTKLINQRSVKAVLEYLKYLYFNEDIYRYNFFSLIDREVETLDRVDLNKNTLLNIVKNVIKKYSLFDADANLLRFLSTVDRTKDIEALLFEYERIDTSAAASELIGVRVLTVHKSKGLEYEHVIVMDRLKKAPPNKDAIIYEYDGIKLQNIYLRIKGRDDLDNNYALALKKEKQLVMEDSLNALYVAFTRARENLFIVKKSKDSTFDILDLSVSKHGVLKVQKAQQEIKKDSLQELKYEEEYYGPQSDIVKIEDDELEADIKAQNFGTALHFMLEMISEFSTEYISDAKDMMINKFGHTLEDDEIEDITNRVSLMLENKEFLELCDGECFKEQSLRFNNNLKYIDLLVKHKDGSYKIIDYKSSTKYSDHHVGQVEEYIEAVEEITGKTAQGHLCYLLKNEVKIVKL